MIRLGARAFLNKTRISKTGISSLKNLAKLNRIGMGRTYMTFSSKKYFTLGACFSQKSQFTSPLLKTISTRSFSSEQKNPVEYMKDFELRIFNNLEDIQEELDEVNSQLKHFEGRITDTEIPKKYLTELLSKMRSMRSPPLSEFALTLNYCIERAGTIEPFDEIWKSFETLSFNAMAFISGESIIDIVYYFCKFRKTSTAFWGRYDSKLTQELQTIDNTEALSKLLLALVMDDRNNQSLYKILLGKIVANMDNAKSQDLFFLAVALSKNIIDPSVFPKDLLSSMYLATVQYIDQYNLSDLSYFLMLFCTPGAEEHIPEEFWEKVIEPQLMQAIEDFETHKQDINIELFLDDYMRCLMGVTMAEQMNEEFWDASLAMMTDNIHELNNHTIENLIYSLTRSRLKKQEIWLKLVDVVIERKLIVEDQMNEFCFLLGVMDNKIDNEVLWEHLDEKFAKLSKYTEAVPVDLLAIYVNCLSHRKTTEEKEEMWKIVEKAAKEERSNQK
ncbi:unnamed protein product [Moneuplotes crassus]|uniref:Uncharacterized protein n=2 Tax=Euplotes crassus TaxID=5936 RepID=A0AAD1UDJ8_EUPCR|nr:unnamed protein product [Moneuplotes crassus]